MHCHNQLIGFRRIVQGLGLISEPEKLFLSVTLADIDKEFDQRLIGSVSDLVGSVGIGSDFDRDSSVVIIIAGGTPGTIGLRQILTDSAVIAYAVIGRRLEACFGKEIAERGCAALTDNAVDRDTRQRIDPLSRVVR